MTDATDREILLEMRGDLKEVRAQVTRTNGRVAALEDWRHEQELKEARAEGIRSASTGVLLTTRQVAMVGGLLSVVASAAGLASRYIG